MHAILVEVLNMREPSVHFEMSFVVDASALVTLLVFAREVLHKTTVSNRTRLVKKFLLRKNYLMFLLC